jgi:hypothetical protein
MGGRLRSREVRTEDRHRQDGQGIEVMRFAGRHPETVCHKRSFLLEFRILRVWAVFNTTRPLGEVPMKRRILALALLFGCSLWWHSPLKLKACGWAAPALVASALAVPVSVALVFPHTASGTLASTVAELAVAFPHMVLEMPPTSADTHLRPLLTPLHRGRSMSPGRSSTGMWLRCIDPEPAVRVPMNRAYRRAWRRGW